MTLRPLTAALALGLLAGCSTAKVSAGTAVAQQATGPLTTLAGLAAAHSTTAADLIAKGALFCANKVTGAVSVVASADAMAAPFASLVPYGAVAVSVIGASANAVAGVCAAIQSVPVPAPTNVATDTVPVVAVQAAAALKPAF